MKANGIITRSKKIRSRLIWQWIGSEFDRTVEYHDRKERELANIVDVIRLLFRGRG